MTGTQAWAVTITVEQGEHLVQLAGVTPPKEQSPTGEPPPRRESATVIYTNDGKGPFPNIGGGTDQELTASVHLRYTFANQGKGWTSGGFNFEIWTPLKGGEPTPLPDFPPGMYPGQPGPRSGGYKGLVYADLAYRLSGTSTRDLTLLTRLGVNSTRLGEGAQTDLVHRPLKIALFDWQHEPNELYAALGLRAQTVFDLINSGSVTEGDFRLRLTVSSEALGGTHQTQAGGAATVSLHSGFVRLWTTTRGAVEFRFGADGNGLVRYNDQGGVRGGLEAAVSNEIRVHLREVDIPLPVLHLLPPFDLTVFAGGRSQQSTLPEGRGAPSEDGPGATGVWLGQGSKTQGWIGLEIPLR